MTNLPPCRERLGALLAGSAAALAGARKAGVELWTNAPLRELVVEDGRVVELGSHDALVAAQGSYAALWESWQGEPSPAP